MVTSVSNNTTEKSDRPTFPFESLALSDYRFRNLHIALVYFLPPLLAAFGIPGNILTILIMSKPRYGKFSTCIYLKAMAVFDLANTVGYYLQRYILLFFPNFKSILGDAYCKEFFFIAHVTGGSSIWTLAFMTLDRAIAVWFPLKAATLCTSRRAKLLCVLIPVFMGIRDCSHLMRVYDHSLFIDRTECVFISPTIKQVAYFTSMIFGCLTCPLIVMGLNLSIIITVHRSNKRQSELTKSNASTNSSTKNQINLVLLVVSWTFCLLTLPYFIDFIYHEMSSKVTTNATQNILRKISYEVILLCLLINGCINFYLYCLTSRKFLLDLKEILFRFGK